MGTEHRRSWATLATLVLLFASGLLAATTLQGVSATVWDQYEIQITSGFGDDVQPAIACNTQNGEYLVVWRQGISNSDIYGIRVTSAGQTIGSPFAICTDAGVQEVPAVTYNGSRNEYLVVWQSGTGLDVPEPDIHVFGRRVSDNGGLLGGVFAISRGIGMNMEVEPDVAHDSLGNRYLVAWRDGTVDVFGQFVAATGELQGGNFVISNERRQQDLPSVAYNPNTNQYLVAWDDHRRDVQWDIYGAILSSSGATAVGNVGVCEDDGDQYDPDVAYCGTTGSFMAVWQDDRAGEYHSEVYGRLVSAQGTFWDGTFMISASYTDTESATLAYDPGLDRYVVAWRDRDGDNIGGRLVNVNGYVDGGPFWFCSTAGDQGAPAIAANTGAGGYLVVWHDQRNGNYDLYGLIRTASVSPSTPSYTPTRTRTPTYTPTATRTPTYTPTRTRTPTYTPTRIGTETPPLSRRGYLPVVQRRLMPTAMPYSCAEPANDTRPGACGPMRPGVVYREYISYDADRDYFYLDMATSHGVDAWLTSIAPECDYELYLVDSDGELVQYSATPGNQSEHLITGLLSAGRYFLLVFGADRTYSATQAYSLSANFE